MAPPFLDNLPSISRLRRLSMRGEDFFVICRTFPPNCRTFGSKSRTLPSQSGLLFSSSGLFRESSQFGELSRTPLFASPTPRLPPPSMPTACALRHLPQSACTVAAQRRFPPSRPSAEPHHLAARTQPVVRYARQRRNFLPVHLLTLTGSRAPCRVTLHGVSRPPKEVITILHESTRAQAECDGFVFLNPADPRFVSYWRKAAG
jgi:hypothetical protein